MASSSALDGATLLAAKELNTKTVITANFLIFTISIKPLSAVDDKDKVREKLRKNWGGRRRHLFFRKNAGFLREKRTVPGTRDRGRNWPET
jgi:hypothetical protein